MKTSFASLALVATTLLSSTSASPIAGGGIAIDLQKRSDADENRQITRRDGTVNWGVFEVRPFLPLSLFPPIVDLSLFRCCRSTSPAPRPSTTAPLRSTARSTESLRSPTLPLLSTRTRSAPTLTSSSALRLE